MVERFSIDAQVRRIEAVYDEELARAGVLLGTTASRGAQAPERGALEVPPV